MADRPITIHSVCRTTPDLHVHVKAGDKVRWRAVSASYWVHISGGFFKGEPNDFKVQVVSSHSTRNYVVAGRPGETLTNYIYDESEHNCRLRRGPPDIIIDSTITKRPKKAGPSKKNRAPAKGKK